MILRDKFGSLKIYCKVAPKIPCASIIQNKTNDPIRGVTIIGNIDPNISGPLMLFDKTLRLRGNKKTQNNYKWCHCKTKC